MTVDSKFVALDALCPADLRQIKKSGLFLPYYQGDKPLLVTVWDGEVFAIGLNAERNYPFWQIKADTKAIGVFFEQPKIVVDLESIARGRSVHDDLGALVLSESRAHIICQRLGDRFNDPVQAQLWHEFSDIKCDEDIAFKNWSIAIGEGIDQRTLWSRGSALTDLDPALAA